MFRLKIGSLPLVFNTHGENRVSKVRLRRNWDEREKMDLRFLMQFPYHLGVYSFRSQDLIVVLPLIGGDVGLVLFDSN